MKDSYSGKQSKKTNHSQDSKDEIINKAFEFHSKGNISKATKFYRIFLNLGFSDARVNSNLGQILRDQGNLKEAELLTRQAIKLDLNYTAAYSNLSIILRDLGKLQEAESSIRKAIELNPNIANSHFLMGIILRDLGNLQEAESSIRKAIELNPNIANSHFLMGNTLRDLGKLEEAEISYLKAIELNPESATPHLNLGIILKDLGRLEEAEISYLKAIAIKPDFAYAHANLGNILVDLGRLQEAEVSTRKAIKLDPDLAGAYSNLSGILRNLGKLNELIHLSKSIIKSESINKGYKLRASLLITISNLIKGDYSETLFNLNQTKKLINQGAINLIPDEQTRKYTSTFFKFITSLYPLLKKSSNNNLKIIPHFGESHCLSFVHQTLSMNSQLNEIQPVLITGAKAWHFASEKHNQWKDSLTQQIKNHKYSDETFISFGEIDCRKDEGILNYATKKNKNISEVCEKTIKGYVNYMEKILTPHFSKKYYFGVPAPLREKQFLDDLDIKRIKLIKIFNSLLKEEVLSRGSFFFDVFALTSNKNGENNNLYMCDQFHLAPKCISILFKDHLHKS